ncbi:MAG: hypothetical protein JXR72_04075 [Proteobacteria bacterium]|nr:hypothetical protein [Pseudomonadota bacterium]
MDLIVLDYDNGSFSGRLHDLALKSREISGAMFFWSATGFLNQLRVFSGSQRIVVILMADRPLLQDLFRLKELFEDVSLFLLLSDHLPDTLSAAHRLHPRFLTFMDEGGDDFMGVLESFIGQQTFGSLKGGLS